MLKIRSGDSCPCLKAFLKVRIGTTSVINLLGSPQDKVVDPFEK